MPWRPAVRHLAAGQIRGLRNSTGLEARLRAASAMEIRPCNASSSPVRSTVKSLTLGADVARGIAGVPVVDRLSVLVAMEGHVLSPSLAAWIRKKTGQSEDLRANLCSFDLIPKPKATLL